MALLGKGPRTRVAIDLLREEAVTLEAVKQRPRLRVVTDPQPAAHRPAARTGMLGDIAKRPYPQQRRQSTAARSAIRGVMAVLVLNLKSLQLGAFVPWQYARWATRPSRNRSSQRAVQTVLSNRLGATSVRALLELHPHRRSGTRQRPRRVCLLDACAARLTTQSQPVATALDRQPQRVPGRRHRQHRRPVSTGVRTFLDSSWLTSAQSRG